MSTPIETDDRSFPNDVPQDGIAVIDFWADWCGPCKQFAPVFTASAAANPDVRHLKVNVDDNPNLSEYFQIRSIPTTVFIRDSITVGQFSGAMSPARLGDLIKQVRSLDMDEVRKAANSN